jgi:hypothetical protein
MESNEVTLANILRVFYRLELMSFTELDRACDDLTIRLFKKDHGG